MDGHLGGLCSLAVVNAAAAVNIRVRVFALGFSYSLDTYPVVQLLGRRAALFSTS